MTKGSVRDARVVVDLPQTRWGHSSDRNSYFPACSSSKVLQQIKPVCLCIVFYIISGQNRFCSLFPGARAANSWPTRSHRCSSRQASYVFLHFTSYFSLLWNFSWIVSYSVVFLLSSFIMTPTKRCCQVKI